MKILYHHRTASRDGQEVHISELVAALRGQGHEVRLVSPAGGDAAGEERGRMGGHHGGLARLRALMPDALLPLAARAYDLLFTRRVVSAGRQFGAEVLYERHALRNRVGMRAAKRLGIPLLLEVNAPLAREEAALGQLGDLDRALSREMETLRSADAVLAVSEVLRQILVDDGLAPERVHVVPNGINPERFLTPRDETARKQWSLDDRLVLGFIGFPRPWHRLERVVDVLAAASAEPLSRAVLLIGGEGPALDDLLSRARQRGVEDRVVQAGVIDRERVASFIDAFDIALQPHATSYASPLKLFEYLARGVAVIAPRQPNLEEIVEDGESALLFDADQDEAFAASLTRLAEDRELRLRLGEGGRRRIVEGGYTWPGNAARVVEVALAVAEVDGPAEAT